MRIKGNKTIRKAQRDVGSKAHQALTKALYLEGEKIMAAAKRQTPVDTGVLRASGHVQKPKVDPGKITVTLGFGGPAAPYAVYVHERTELRHHVGKAKYLEDPFREAMLGIEQRLASAIKRELGR